MDGEHQEVTLSPMEYQFAAAIAASRVAPKTTGGTVFSGSKDAYEVHLEGAVGELCFTKVHGGEVNQRIYQGGDKHQADIVLPDGRGVEVKTSSYKGRDVTIKFTPSQVNFEWCCLVQLLSARRCRVFPIWSKEDVVSNGWIEDYGYGKRLVCSPSRIANNGSRLNDDH